MLPSGAFLALAKALPGTGYDCGLTLQVEHFCMAQLQWLEHASPMLPTNAIRSATWATESRADEVIE